MYLLGGIFEQTHLTGRELVDDKFIRNDFLSIYKNTNFLSESGLTLKYDTNLKIDYEDEVIVYHELGLKNASNRVEVISDISLLKKSGQDYINIGIEIKSDKDTVSRLDNQIKHYKRYYDYVYILTTSKLIGEVVEKAGKNIGIILYEGKGMYKIVQVAKKVSTSKSVKNWARLLWLSELEAEFKVRGVDYKKNPLLRYKNQKVNMYNSLYLKQYKVKGEVISDYTNVKEGIYNTLKLRALEKNSGLQKQRHIWDRKILIEDNYIEIKSGKI